MSSAMSDPLATTIADEDRRLPYFYTDGLAVLCPECVADLLEFDSTAGKRISAHYTAARMYRCGSCMVIIGPVSAEEAKSA